MKNRINKDQLLAEGVVHFGYDSKGNLWDHGTIVTKAAESPIKPKADVVAAILQKTNAAPRITDAPRKQPSTATGLQRAIEANIRDAGGEVLLSKIDESGLTGLQRAIEANIRDAEAKKKSS
jgi:hypothetical protein